MVILSNNHAKGGCILEVKFLDKYLIEMGCENQMIDFEYNVEDCNLCQFEHRSLSFMETIK